MSDHLPQPARPAGGPRETARLNDRLRDNITQPGNDRVMMTTGIADLLGDVSIFRNFRKRADLLRLIRGFDAFTPANDPYGEHDLGSFDFEGVSCLWKIDYYNTDLSAGSEDPGDPAVTVRVLTIMRAEER
ncbi:DUF3768 domain-containing protein [Sphingomonas sp. GM_Shp_2]|uniref:DUF3768 domain-containing protein n=1 Tax=Sphingomonas sp. GM_Shp_2 TaxID=2937380 RepID=UPI00226A1BB2|nr:DUF3768 domain-containing protein [Sphingomonas sp. GM_Shp_2]